MNEMFMFSPYCNAVLSIFSSFAIVSSSKRELFALIWLCFCCRLAIVVRSRVSSPWCLWFVYGL